MPPETDASRRALRRRTPCNAAIMLAIRNDSQAAAPATAPASPRRANMPAPMQVTPGPPTSDGGGRSVVTVDNRSEVRDFLASRRARIRPDQAGLPAFVANRRVPGLRREEVALLAGVSVDYYTRLERGNLNGVSESVLGALAGALQLDEAERAHLFDLARGANARRSRRRPGQQLVRTNVQRILDAMVGTPAYARNGQRDILAANRLGYALYSEAYLDPARPVNIARFVFLSTRARAFFLNWESAANDTVAILRTEAGRNPYDQGLTQLVGELSTRSEEFRTRWAAHNVRLHRTGFKDIHHPVVGDLHLSFEAMDLPADPGLSIVVYSAEPGSASEDGLSLLASWAATLDQTEIVNDPMTDADYGIT
jgi:transcriptional regulator with XRE-family HTH domain